MNLEHFSIKQLIFLIKFTLVTEYFAMICFNRYSRLTNIMISRKIKTVTITSNKKFWCTILDSETFVYMLFYPKITRDKVCVFHVLYCLFNYTYHVRDICTNGSKMKIPSGRTTNQFRNLLYIKIHNNLFSDFTNKSTYIILGLKMN